MSDRPILDQAAHLGAAFIVLLPAALWPGPLTFALVGGFLGFVREITEVSPLVTWESIKDALADGPSRLDFAFWTLGGFLAGFGVYA